MRSTPAQMREQYLDSMDIERERGITIKAQNVRVPWRGHTLHLIDTPGHVDFGYEVSRILAACEGVVLLVDASQGIQAQTLANCYQALEHDLEIVAVLNKIDLPAADPERYAAEIEHGARHRRRTSILRISAKTGEGVPELLDAIVRAHPARRRRPEAPLRALIFDSAYDQYRGVVSSIRVVDGTLHRRRTASASCRPGRPRDRGDRRADPGHRAGRRARPRRGRLPDRRHQGRRRGPLRRDGDRRPPARPPRRSTATATRSRWSSAGSSRSTATSSPTCARRLEKLRLNDASFTYEPESSGALGFGFRCGFLGLLHMEIVRERLEREFDLSLIATAPSVAYRAFLTDGTEVEVDNPSEMPEPASLDHVDEPMLTATILTPAEYTGTVMDLCQAKRAEMVQMEYLSPERVELVYVIPLAEVVVDFFDQLKSRTKGYASLDYEPAGYADRRPGQGRPADQPRAGRRLLDDRPQVAGRLLRPAHDREAARADPPPDVRRAHPGRHRRPGHRPGDGQGQAQGRAGQVLRRRHHPQAEAAREAEGGQEEDEEHRPRRGPPGGVRLRPPAGRLTRRPVAAAAGRDGGAWATGSAGSSRAPGAGRYGFLWSATAKRGSRRICRDRPSANASLRQLSVNVAFSYVNFAIGIVLSLVLTGSCSGTSAPAPMDCGSSCWPSSAT